ncbi:MAG: cytochrome c3 family protein [Planctomycetota bacterium]
MTCSLRLTRTPAATILMLVGAVLWLAVLPASGDDALLDNPHDLFRCTDCHDPHGNDNLYNIYELLDTPNSGPRPVLFLNLEGPNSFADGDAVYDGVCEVCHTVTDFHRNDDSGDHSHFAGQNCAACHDHWDGFRPIPHPQANTDCSNCHWNPSTQQPDLVGIHGGNCRSCHPVDFDSTFLGPIGSWNGECSHCHNPGVPETGGLEEPTKGHRCIVCHGEQMPVTSPSQSMHRDHAGSANCVVCHGFIPDVGTEVGSGNRQICAVCHDPSTYEGVGQTYFHKKHVRESLSCLECHGDERPPVDIVDGPPVGDSTRVCQTCHKDQFTGGGFLQPSRQGSELDSSLHKRHSKNKLDCGSCHIDAHLQDDRVPMPPIDDARRALVDRGGFDSCYQCHGGGKSGDSPEVHSRHVAEQYQWCYNCHEATDTRPLGLQPPVTSPAESCRLCHEGRTYDDLAPFNVHHEHAARVKCYACHQAAPDLFDWPAAWMTPGA